MFKINHVGIVTKSIDQYLENSLYERIVADVFDPLQEARLALIETQPQDCFIELIEPQAETSATWNFLQKNGGGLHHICYEVADPEELEEVTKAKRIKLFAGPMPAVLFGGREVAFGINRNREIVEFLISEYEPSTSQ